MFVSLNINNIQIYKSNRYLPLYINKKAFTFFCLYIEKANERITEFKSPIRMSPAPGFDGTFVR